MPFLAIVYVRDADTARALLDRKSDDTGFGHLVGLYRFPNRAELTCKGFCANRKRMSPWRRHKRGHMVCGVCGGRHRETRRRLVGSLFDYLGANLLKNKAPALFRTPENYG